MLKSKELLSILIHMQNLKTNLIRICILQMTVIILTAGILSVIKFVQPRKSEDQPKIQLSPMPAEEASGNVSYNDYCVGGVTVTPAPVPVFGLSPLNSQFVKLLSEEVVFNRDSTRVIKIDEHYNVEMRYTVEIAEKTEFVLPCSVTSYGFESENSDTEIMTDQFTEIYVNGDKANINSSRHHNAALYSRSFEIGNLQSVLIFPNHADGEAKSQMENTYELLIQAWLEPMQRPDWWQDTDMPELTLLEESRSEHIDMNTFTIENPGIYTIEIKTAAIGNHTTDEFPIEMIQWIDSPRSMWSDAGERNLTVVIGGEKYSSKIKDGVCDFELPKMAQ